jgi:TM2 domain-containing membrane protein YozV
MKRIQEKHAMPALLSFFIAGLGQIVKGEVGKGLLIMLGMVVSGTLCILLIGFILVPVLWFWNIYDAYNAQV